MDAYNLIVLHNRMASDDKAMVFKTETDSMDGYGLYTDWQCAVTMFEHCCDGK